MAKSTTAPRVLGGWSPVWTNNMDDKNFDREAVRRMMEEATLSMTGEPVTIHLRHPIIDDFSGQVYRARDGRLAFDIDSTLDLPAFYEAWLHEVCHIHLGHCDDMLPRDLPQEIEGDYLAKGPLFILSKSEKEAYKEDPQEREVNQIIGPLNDFLTNHARDRFGHDGYMARIRYAMDLILQKGE